MEIHQTTAPKQFTLSGYASLACSFFGCLGLLGLVPLLDGYDQSEQLARHFAALVNAIVIASIGGPSAILVSIGAWLSNRARSQGDFKLARWGKSVSGVGVVLILAVVVFYLLPALRRLN